jgi:hypothetical protein
VVVGDPSRMCACPRRQCRSWSTLCCGILTDRAAPGVEVGVLAGRTFQNSYVPATREWETSQQHCCSRCWGQTVAGQTCVLEQCILLEVVPREAEIRPR